MVRLNAGGMLSQNLGSRAYISNKPSRVRIRVIAEQPATLSVMLGGKTLKQEIEPGDNIVVFEYDTQLPGTLTLMTSAEVLLDDVQVYSHITEGGIYDVDGIPGPYLSGMREMNAAMD